MSKVDNFLAHYGVMGMKWGIRKARSGYIKPRATMNFLDRHEQKWVDENYKISYNRVYRKSASGIRKGVRLLNADPKYMGKDFRRDSALRREYYSAYSKMVTEQLNANIWKRRLSNPLMRAGLSPLRKFELHFEYDANKELRPRVTVRRSENRAARKGESLDAKLIRKFKSIGHSEDVFIDEMEVLLTYDEMGFITDFTIPELEGGEMEQSDDMDEFLEHWGILGMKWGVRRPVGPDGLIRESPYRNGKVKVGDLSDEDLRKVINRIELEKKYVTLTKSESKIKIGSAIVGGILVASGKKVAEEYLTSWLKKEVGKVAAKAAKGQ